MTQLQPRPGRVYAVASPQISMASATAGPGFIQCLEDAVAQLGAQVYSIDRELRIVHVCSAQNPDRSSQPSELIVQPTPGQPILTCVAPDQRAALQSACEAVLHGQQPLAICDLAVPNTATSQQLRLTITPAYSADGALVGATLTGWPVTSTKQAAQRDQQRTRLLGLLNHIGARLASELDEDAIVHIVTKALVAQLGLAFARIWLLDQTNTTLVLRSSAGLYTATDGDFARVLLGQHIVGQIAALRQPLVTNDVPNTPGLGGRSWAIATGMRAFAGYPLIGRDRLIGVVAFFSYHPLDEETIATLEPLAHQLALALERAQLAQAQIAARDEALALAAMATSRATQLSATLGVLADGVWTCDQNGRLLTVNAAALRMFGLDPQQRQPEMLSDVVQLFTPETPQRELCLGLPAALEGRTVHRELVLLLAHVERAPLTVAVTATPMCDKDGQVIGAVAVVRDITQQKAMERLKDDFLSVAAHELKTPVTAIKGYAQLALMRLKSGDSRTLQRALKTIEEQSQRIANLVNELVDARRIQRGQLDLRLDRLDLAGLVRRVVEQAQLQAPLHQLTLDAPATLPLIGDELRIEQVLQNLLENAIKYSLPGSPIRVVVDVSAGMARVVVIDRGIGISREKQAYVFDAWFQAHGDTVGDFGGMGLGLNICKEVVERHGGQIWVESAQDQGSSFGFNLPLPPAATT